MSLLQQIIGLIINYGGMVVFLISLIANIGALRSLKRENPGRARRWVKVSLYTMLLWLVLFLAIIGWAMYQSNQMMQAMQQLPDQPVVQQQSLPATAAPEAAAPAESAAPAATPAPETVPAAPEAK